MIILFLDSFDESLTWSFAKKTKIQGIVEKQLKDKRCWELQGGDDIHMIWRDEMNNSINK